MAMFTASPSASGMKSLMPVPTVQVIGGPGLSPPQPVSPITPRRHMARENGPPMGCLSPLRPDGLEEYLKELLVHSRLIGLLLIALCGCDAADAHWQIVLREEPGALLSIWGTSAHDVWLVGGDPGDGHGPMVLHYDGAAWR